MANNFPTEYGTAPVGRIIMGDPFNKQTKDQNGKDIPLDKQRFFFGVAVAKDAPGVNEMLGTLQKAAMGGYAANPQIMNQINMGLNATAFSWKVQDGDEMVVDQQTGQQKLRSQYGAGCWIFKYSTTMPVRAAMFPQGSNIPVDCSSDQIKKGYFVQVSYSTTINGNQDHTAGIYLNPKTCCLVGFGEEIVSGPSLEQQFEGANTGYVPAGMTMTPQAPTGASGMGQGQNMGGQNGGMDQGGNMGNGNAGAGMQQGGDPASSNPATGYHTDQNNGQGGGGMPAPSGHQQHGQYGGYMNG